MHPRSHFFVVCVLKPLLQRRVAILLSLHQAYKSVVLILFLLVHPQLIIAFTTRFWTWLNQKVHLVWIACLVLIKCCSKTAPRKARGEAVGAREAQEVEKSQILLERWKIRAVLVSYHNLLISFQLDPAVKWIPCAGVGAARRYLNTGCYKKMSIATIRCQ